jgi:phage regulator Rha-like protein
MELMKQGQQATMSSLEIAELTGKDHKHVMRDIRAMCEQLGVQSAQFWADYKDARGRAQHCFYLDRYHTEVLVTGYDVKRRAAVIKRWYDLETGQAQPAAIKDPQLAVMVQMLTQLDAVKQEQQAQRLELADIKAKITATPEEYYTVAGFASLRGVSVDTKRANFLGRKAAMLSRDYGIHIGKAHSEIYGAVNTYHVDVLCEVFQA